MLKAIFRKCKQSQIVGKKQTAGPAASNSANLVDSAVTFYLILMKYKEEWW